MAEQTQEFFENPLDYQYKIIKPDSNLIFKDFTELNKDIVTTKLKEKEIQQFITGGSIIGECDNLGGVLDGFKSKILREMMLIVNITKSRDGFLLKQMTEQRSTSSQKIEGNLNKKFQVGKD